MCLTNRLLYQTEADCSKKKKKEEREKNETSLCPGLLPHLCYTHTHTHTHTHISEMTFQNHYSEIPEI